MDITSNPGSTRRLKVAIIGSGISGLSAAWLLSQRHDVTMFEASDRIGGHSNTVEFNSAVGPVAVDTGFIVYNEVTYPNLTALFRALKFPQSRRICPLRFRSEMVPMNIPAEPDLDYLLKSPILSAHASGQ